MWNSGSARVGDGLLSRSSRALQPCPEDPSAKLHKPMAVELPLPLTEAVVAKALAELSQGAAAALESCLECYRSKRMSSADLLSFARSTSIHSPSLAAVFKVKDADAQDMGEAAGADDMAELMSLLGSGPAPRQAPRQPQQPPPQQTKQQQPVAGRTSLASVVSKINSEIVILHAAVAALNSASCSSTEPCARPQTSAGSAAGRGRAQLNPNTITPAHTAVAASTDAPWSARSFSPLPALSPILEETGERRIKWAPVIAATTIIIDDLATPKSGVVRSVPAVTLSCLQAVCDAANAGCVRLRPAPVAVPEKAHAEALERTESTLSLADTPTARAAPGWDRCDSDLSSASTVIIPAPVARGTLTLKASASHAGSMRSECTIENCTLTLKIDSVVVVEVPLKNLAVGLQQGRDNMFTIATVHKNKIYDEIFCFADDQAKRDEWISIFRGMGVATFDSGARYKREKK